MWTISWKCPQTFHFIDKIKRNIKEKYCQRLIFLFLSIPLDLLTHIRNPSQYNFDIYHQYTEGPFLCYKVMGYSSALTFLELSAIIMYGVFSSFCFCGSEFLFVFSFMSDFSFLVSFHFLYFINKVFLSQKKNNKLQKYLQYVSLLSNESIYNQREAHMKTEFWNSVIYFMHIDKVLHHHHEQYF